MNIRRLSQCAVTLCCIMCVTVSGLTQARADESGAPRKVVVATLIEDFFGEYPGLGVRLGRMTEVVAEASAQADKRFPGDGLDLVVFPEAFVNRMSGVSPADKAMPIDGEISRVLGGCARRYSTYIVAPMILDEKDGTYTNVAVLFDRKGEVAGIYRKVHPVARLGTDILEGGIAPGREFPVFTCDFGRIGMLICYDMSYEDGWRAYGDKGAEIVIVPTMSPQTVRPAAFANRHNYFVVTSTPRNNATIFNPIGMHHARLTEDGVLVERIDLSYEILNWSVPLRNGEVLREKYGDSVGYVYYESEDCGMFWSNDPAKPIAEMINALELVPQREEVERIRILQDDVRGGPVR